MSSSTGNFRPSVTGWPLVIMVAAALLLRPLERRVETRTVPAGLAVEQMAALAGQGGSLAVMGGMRSMVASGFWLRANLAWEHGDQAETAALIDLTVAADERPLYFWLNGARIMAYDFPAWRLGGAPVPRAVRQRVIEEQARVALGFLERGLRWHGPAAELFIEMANIHLRQLGDLENAARCYRLAAEQPGAPYYAARIHGELLQALGRPEEARNWLREILPGLPADDPAARREVVVERIAMLERELGAR